MLLDVDPIAKVLRYVDWLRLTHGGRRSPGRPVCPDCRTKMTEAEVEEYFQKEMLPLIEMPRVVDPEDAKRRYLAATN